MATYETVSITGNFSKDYKKALDHEIEAHAGWRLAHITPLQTPGMGDRPGTTTSMLLVFEKD